MNIKNLKMKRRLTSLTVFLFYNFVDKRINLLYNMLTFKIVIRSRGQGEPVNEESPSVIETGCRRNPGEGDFKESATENNRPKFG